ncbi:MAG: aldehyde dehydrogenase (NADP(+)) [Planctomycetes bacterium]|nr:aldehyde dehydrogenase (NADP(+)) [Planctomycetota bacterium]
MTTTPSLTGSSWILGAPTEPLGAPRFRARAAADGRELAVDFHAASERDVGLAADGARGAFAATTFDVRARLLERVAELLAARGAAIVERAMLETGLARPRLEGELARTTNQLRTFAALVREGSWVDVAIDHGDLARAPLPKPDVRSMLVPLGPVAVFGASNFPLAFSVAGGDTASALASGCPVVVKGHPLHPGTGELAARAIVDAVAECELAPGTFAFLQAGGAREVAVGLELVRHPAIAAVGFTGSSAAGTTLTREAALRARPIPVFAEMGSTNPVFLLPGAVREKRDAIVSALSASIAGSAGQLCTRPGIVGFVRGHASDALVERLAQALGASAPQTMLSSAHRDAWHERIERLQRLERVQRLGAATASTAAGVTPVLLRTDLATLEEAPELAEECFGPSALLVECANEDELVDLAQQAGGTLTVTIWSAASDRAFLSWALPLLARDSGRIVHDGVPTGVEVCAAMVHSGPFPACSRPDSTSVGARAIRRWCRPMAFQNVPDELLPDELREANPRGITRLVDGKWRA